jgi:SAM-dependent methyltransferase
MKGIKRCASKTHADLVREWDRLAEERYIQLTTGKDLSFRYVVVPTALRLFQESDRSVVVEIGCGTGVFTRMLAGLSGSVLALDPSQASIAIAKNVCKDLQNVHFFSTSIECAALSATAPVTSAIALMTLMTTPNLEAFANALAGHLETDARFVAVLTHPCFWPRYRGYEDAPWFRYSEELFIEAPFRISNCTSEVVTTHIHRPVERYLKAFSDAGFRLDELVEPMPASEVQALYPRRWEFPRFLGLRWIKG